MSNQVARRARAKLLTRFVFPLALAVISILPFFFNARGIVDIAMLSTVDNAVYDAKINIMTADTVDPRIVIIDIDDPSLLEEGQWPWPRDKLAKMVDTLFSVYGIRVLGFDVVFAEADRVTQGVREALDQVIEQKDVSAETRALLSQVRNSRDTDLEFANALSSWPTVLGYIFTKKVPGSPIMQVGKLPPPIPLQKQGDFAAYPVQAAGYLANLPVLQDATSDAGFFDNPMVDKDGVFRRLPLLQYYKGELYETLGLALLRRALAAGYPVLGSNDEQNPDVDFVQVEELRIPVDDNLAVLAPYRGPQFSFPYVSASDVLHERADIDVLFDSIAIVGTTAPGLFDLRSTPVGNTYAGVEVHANLISGILDGRIWSVPDWADEYELASLVIVALILGLAMPHLSPVAGALLVGVVLVFGLLANFIMAFGALLVLPVASFVGATFSLSLMLIGLNVVTERRKKRYLSRTFAKYVPQELVAQFESTEVEVTLEGESREMSVMFSDVRDFTSISEHLAPTELTRLMNEYLTPVTQVIHSYRGNVDKYIGDAVMAFWGAPQPNPNHAQDAVDAALGMLKVLVEVNQRFRAKNWPELRIGVGINTGVVNIGNMGSEFRTAYTVMGDVVNLASRVEGLCKVYGVEIIVGEDVHAGVSGYAFRELDRVRVKGKEEPVTIYQPLGLARELPDRVLEEVEAYSDALKIYREQDWSAAHKAFSKLHERYPGVYLYGMYAQRSDGYQHQPPPKDWDGVYKLETK